MWQPAVVEAPRRDPAEIREKLRELLMEFTWEDDAFDADAPVGDLGMDSLQVGPFINGLRDLGYPGDLGMDSLQVVPFINGLRDLGYPDIEEARIEPLFRRSLNELTDDMCRAPPDLCVDSYL